MHLRPYVANANDLDILLDAFRRTARGFRGSEEQLRRNWSYLERMAEEGSLAMAVQELRTFFGEMEAGGFLAVHHSEEFTRTYRPAYRVVMRKYHRLT